MKKKIIANCIIVTLIAGSISIPVHANAENPPTISMSAISGCTLNFDYEDYETDWITSISETSKPTVKIMAGAGESAISGISYISGNSEEATFVNANSLTVGYSSDGIMRYSDIYAIDVDGDASSSYSLTIKVDTTNPIVNSFTSIVDNKKNQVELNFEVSDETSGVSKIVIDKYNASAGTWGDISNDGEDISLERTVSGYLGTMNVNENGTYRVWVSDTAGNSTTQNLIVTGISESSPSLSVSLEEGTAVEVSNHYYVASKSINVRFKALKGEKKITDFAYTHNGRIKSWTRSSGASSLDITTSKFDPSLETGLNEFTNIYVKDAGGNVTYVDDFSIYVDIENPSILNFGYSDNITDENKALGIFYSTRATLSVEAEDNFMLSKLVWYYSEDGEVWKEYGESTDLERSLKEDEEETSAATGSYLETYNVSDNGFYYVEAYDYIGLCVSSNIIEINTIDNDGPAVEIKADRTSVNDWFVDEVNIILAGADIKSGYDYVSYSIDGGTEFIKANTEIHIEESTTLYYRAYDKLGNVTAGKALIKIDKSDPELQMTIPENNGFVKMAEVTYVANDAESGIAVTYLEIYDGNTWGAAAATNEAQFLVKENGIYRIRSVDKAGRSTISDWFEINNIDNTAPNNIQITSIESIWGAKCDIHVTGDDNYSGIKSIEIFRESEYGNEQEVMPIDSKYYLVGENSLTIENDFTIEENGNYVLVVTDRAENAAAKSFVVSNIDSGNPIVMGVDKNTDEWTSPSIMLTIKYFDSESGIVKIELQKLVGKDEWKTIEEK